LGQPKQILSCRGYGSHIRNGKKYSKMINNNDPFIWQSERMKSEFVKDCSIDDSKIDIIYNTFDLQLITKKYKKKIRDNIQGFIDTHRTICTVGSFKRDKGYWHLIKSFVKVKQTIRDAGLIFIGHRGEMEKEIKRMAKNSGCMD